MIPQTNDPESRTYMLMVNDHWVNSKVPYRSNRVFMSNELSRACGPTSISMPVYLAVHLPPLGYPNML
jgi:hypothetical protein